MKPPPILTPSEQDAMRQAGKFNAQLMDALRGMVQIGVSLNEIDDFVREYTYSHGHLPACLGYRGYPKSICTSPNEVVCHGIPDDTRLKDGDIVNIDITTIVDGWHGDQSETFLIGEVKPETTKLVQTTFESLNLAIDQLEPGDKVGKIGKIIEDHATKHGFSVVRNFQGHGIGRKFHQEPWVPHFKCGPGDFVRLEPGVCFTIEPMINAGRIECRVEDDNWTAVTMDGSMSAQFEHTILMTDNGPEILTQTQNGPTPGHDFALQRL